MECPEHGRLRGIEMDGNVTRRVDNIIALDRSSQRSSLGRDQIVGSQR